MPAQVDRVRAAVAKLSDTEVEALTYDWRGIWARPEQLAPDRAWRTWLICAGRGFGKTRTGAEWVREQVAAGRKRVALVARTAADARDVMVEGESGLLAVCPPWDRPTYEPSKRRLTWRNGAIATTYSADEPNLLRGPQHDAAWCDELASWQYPDAWDQLLLGLRLGEDPRVIVTTTPRPTKLVRDLMGDPLTTITRGSTYANRANLAPGFIAAIERRYAGTRLGRQELEAEILDDTPGALWTRAQLDATRVRVAPELVRVVVAVDPAASAGEDSDETGIVVAGLASDGQAYVLADLSARLSPDGWGRRAAQAFAAHKADRLVIEANQGGDMATHVLRTVDRNLPIRAVHASRGKQARAEPCAALYEQGRVHHVGALAEMEDQLCTWVPGGDSPDRLDALVWALTDLCLTAPATPHIWRI